MAFFLGLAAIAIAIFAATQAKGSTTTPPGTKPPGTKPPGTAPAPDLYDLFLVPGDMGIFIAKPNTSLRLTVDGSFTDYLSSNTDVFPVQSLPLSHVVVLPIKNAGDSFLAINWRTSDGTDVETFLDLAVRP